MEMGFLRLWLRCLLWMLVGPVMIGMASSSPATEDCSTTSVDECYRNVQTFLRLTELPYTSSKEELDGFCQQAISGYNCSQSLFHSKCVSEKDRQMLPLFTSMGEYMFFMLCGSEKIGNGYLREAFLSHSQCVLEHKKEMQCCAEETHITNLPVMVILEESSKSLPARELMTCCPVSRYLQCTSDVVRRSCGESAANFTGEYIRRAAGEDVQLVCQKVPGYPEPDSNTCPKEVPTCNGAVATATQLSMVVWLASAVVAVLFEKYVRS